MSKKDEIFKIVKIEDSKTKTEFKDGKTVITLFCEIQAEIPLTFSILAEPSQ